MATPVDKPRDSVRRRGVGGIIAPQPSNPPRSEQPLAPEAQIRELIAQGTRDAEAWQYVEAGKSGAAFADRCRRVRSRIDIITRALDERKARGDELSVGETWLLENFRLLQSVGQEVSDALRSALASRSWRKGMRLSPAPSRPRLVIFALLTYSRARQLFRTISTAFSRSKVS